MRTPSESLADLLLGHTRAAILQLLLGRPDEELHVRAIARLTHAGLGHVQRDLKRLSEASILQHRTVGRQLLYRANPASSIYPELRSLLLKTAGAAGLLTAALAPLSPHIQVAFLFGSVARRQETAASDIDLFVVGDLSFATLVAALEQPQRHLGRDINPNLYPAPEFAAKLQAGHHFLTSVIGGPKVFLLGDDRELARVAKQRLASAAPDQPRRNRQAARRRRSRSQGQR